MSGRMILLCMTCVSLYTWAGSDEAPPPPPGYVGIDAAFNLPAGEGELQAARHAGDLDAQRRHLWQVLAALTHQSGGTDAPAFLTWFGAGEVFAHAAPVAAQEPPRALSQAFQLPDSEGRGAHPSATPPLIIRAHYNWTAYRHIRSHGLKILTGAMPEFPRDAVIVKTVWWPVPSQRIVAVPVWDPADNPARTGGNDFPTWARAVATSAELGAGTQSATTAVEFMGRSFPQARRVGIERFYHIVLDQRLAEQLMQDTASRRAALMVLGRTLHARDVLALVALHVATRETADWVWATFWWHDVPDQGPYATLRPAELAGPWRNYLMTGAFDADLPREADGTPHIAFNPWLEARLPDSGNGGGVVSNCMACHQRASMAAVAPFAVTRGGVGVPADHGAAVPALRTSSLWSIPLQGLRTEGTHHDRGHAP